MKSNKILEFWNAIKISTIIVIIGYLFTGITGLSKTGIQDPMNIFDDFEKFRVNPFPTLFAFITVILLLATLLFIAGMISNSNKKRE
jgi:formate hydrogenlyase subunit 3/multisubunit Na+/H+ antiporter MnhD subunit